MACKQFIGIINRYIEGTITLEEKALLEEHVRDCADCKEELEELQGLVRTLNSMESVSLPTNFTPILIERIRELPVKQERQVKLSSFLEFFRNLPGLFSSFYHNNKKFLAGAFSVFIIGIIILTVLNNDPLNIQFSDLGNLTKKEIADEAMPFDYEMPEEAKEFMAGGAAPQTRNLMSTADQAESIDLKKVKAEQKIIRDVDLHLSVRDFDNKVEAALNLADNRGGYVENSYISEKNSSTPRSAHISMRVPQEDLPQVIEELKSFGKLKNQRITGENITEVYYDTSARVHNLKQQEQRLLEILQMANNVDEILKIENELNRVRTDIELLTGQLVSWDKRVQFSLINLQLVEQEPLKEKFEAITLNTFFNQGKQGFIVAINFLMRILVVFAKIIGAILIMIPLIIIFLFRKPLYRLYRKIFKL